ncbi:MAG: hypothetical protein ACRD3F_07550 [Acidobacteriaceae bacterium]
MVSSRFHAAVKSAIFRIEHNAFQDEDKLTLLVSDDHRRRQRLLIEKQIDKAFQLRDLCERLDSPGVEDCRLL